ncbi:hypothetical protein Hanom_Chr17g01579921 [Helianthus anomalus]
MIILYCKLVTQIHEYDSSKTSSTKRPFDHPKIPESRSYIPTKTNRIEHDYFKQTKVFDLRNQKHL